MTSQWGCNGGVSYLFEQLKIAGLPFVMHLRSDRMPFEQLGLFHHKNSVVQMAAAIRFEKIFIYSNGRVFNSQKYSAFRKAGVIHSVKGIQSNLAFCDAFDLHNCQTFVTVPLSLLAYAAVSTKVVPQNLSTRHNDD